MNGGREAKIFRKMKRYSIALLITLAWLGITVMVFCYQTEVTDISGAKYFPVVNEAIAKAQKSISVAMFAVESFLSRTDSKPSKLINALIEEKNREVDVEVILDQNVDFAKRILVE